MPNQDTQAVVESWGVVNRALMDWRHEALSDHKEFYRRDREFLHFRGLFCRIFGPLGPRDPK